MYLNSRVSLCLQIRRETKTTIPIFVYQIRILLVFYLNASIAVNNFILDISYIPTYRFVTHFR